MCADEEDTLPDYTPVTLALAEHYGGSLEAACQGLVVLLERTDVSVLTFTSLAVYQLAGVPLLRNPLGAAGAVEGLVEVMRR